MIIRGTLRLAATRKVRDESDRLALFIIIGTIPAVIVGGLGENWIDDHLGDPWQIAILLGVFGLLLGYADRRPERRDIGASSATTPSRSASLRRSRSPPASRARA